jgi:Mn-dependent DtxR family transcriptional regulator
MSTLRKALAVAHPVEKPAPGFFTVTQWAEREEVSDQTAARMLRELFKAGAVERRHYKQRTTCGRLFPVTHFKLIKQ